MRIPQISRLTNVSPKMVDIAPKTSLFRTIWLISEISHLITVFELTDLDLLKVYFFKFQSLRFEQWIEQVRSNFRHATTVRGPMYGHAIEFDPSMPTIHSSNHIAARTAYIVPSGFALPFHAIGYSSLIMDGPWRTPASGCPNWHFFR